MDKLVECLRCRKHLLCIIAISAILPSLSFAQAPELLISVTGEENRRVAAANEYFLKKDGYFAKRHRIVRLNTDLLFGSETNLTITLFDDVSFRVNRIEIERRNGGDVFTWHGQYELPFNREAYIKANRHMSVENANRRYDNLVDLKISGSLYVFDRDVAQAEEISGMRQDSQTGLIVNERLRLAGKLQRGTVVYSINSDLRPLLPPEAPRQDGSPFYGMFQIRSLPMDLRYAAVYEIDPSKNVKLVDGARSLTSSEVDKHRRYREFVDSLGENPREAALRRLDEERRP